MSSALESTPQRVIDGLTRLQTALMEAPQIDLQTEHIIHGGIYTRTIRLDGGIWLVGALIKVPTLLIVSGNTRVFTGESWIELEGFHIIPAKAGRKQVFVTHEPTVISMSFKTEAKTVEQAEKEFTDEFELLMSHRSDRDTVVITEEA
jgi:hypothetical protein